MPLEPFHLERYFAATEFTTPHLLAVSDCESRSVADLLALEPGAAERLGEVRLGYTETRGSLELRRAVAAGHARVGADDVLVHATAVEVLHTTMHALLEPGDRVVVQMPAYQALRSAPAMAGAEVVPWWGRPDRGWAPDPDALPALLAAPRTRMLVINTPHNPTGWYADEATLGAILGHAGAAGVRVFCDEAYRGTAFRGGEAPSAVDLSDHALALGLVSKGLGLPGLRTGWLVTRDAEARARVEAFKDFTSICGPAPSEFLAALALRQRERILDETRALLRSNLARLEAFMERRAAVFDWAPPDAGPVTLPRLRDPERWGGAEGFCRRARHEAGVLLAPGGLFGGVADDTPGGRATAQGVRMGFGRASFPRALEVFDAWLEAATGR